jgi:two-component system CheB/CheR fusion protein
MATPKKRVKRPKARVQEPARTPPASQPSGGPCPIVGVGASAGGIEAVRSFLSEIPADTGMAYVVVLHLAPGHKSLLSEILARSTPLPVVEAADGAPVKPDHVLVIPPNRDIAVSGGKVRLSPRPSSARAHFPVDHLFRSLAEECGNKAIGVVFSGTSADGMQGCKAIKLAGGITFAQDEESAKYGDMPRNAAASGSVDMILSPQGIARELGRLRSHAYVLHPLRDADEGAEQDGTPIDGLLALLRASSGIDFTYYKQSTIRRRILRRMALARLDRLEDYESYARGNRTELETLADDVLINVTSFFRDGASFQALRKRVFPALSRRREEDQKIRIWVPGCSSGEEVYSLAVELFEFLGERSGPSQVQLFGTDVSERVIERARAGRYPASIASDVSAERLRRYFVRTAQGYQVGKTLREACIFARHNLVKDPPFSRLDLVSCRNVLIYFTPPLQKRAIALFHYALKSDGFLVLGASEHLAGHAERFALVDKKHRVYAKRAGGLSPLFGLPPHEAPAAGRADAPAVPDDETRALEIQREADRLSISRFVPAGVVVDENFDIVQFRGHTGPYLDPRAGSASLNLLKMAREGLVVELRTLVQRARREGRAVRRERVPIRSDEGQRDVNLEAIPFSTRRMKEGLYLVVFDAAGAPVAKRAPLDKRPRKAASKKRASRTAENELAATKEYLQTIIEEQEATNEELMSANEEILSSNEELQSTNEELETAKEELQSSNEELSTVNEELQNRNTELDELNNDLTNLLGTMNVSMLILDLDLRIRRASPMAEKLLNLIPADVGRRLTDMRPNVEIPDVGGLVQGVIETVTPRHLQVHDAQGRTYSMHVRPYKTRDRRIDGVVITWVDLSGPLAGTRTDPSAVLEGILAALPHAAAVMDGERQVRVANDAWRRRFEDATPGPEELLSDAVRWVARDGKRKEGTIAVGGTAVTYRATPCFGEPGSVLVTLDEPPAAS